ncbi:MAG TPA: response regulator transcription factor [Dinghuibacter sp.]|uniref:response regulator transcription factor n=1 Tax=Dinghuibacter sp. TaxID=2024697 RepID=UPI002B5115F6|nr:response regulator transcription factor [Dinghuibacter sp.]HTJ12991.1 response regulator transcription factor [Dinghuibacter sp.]
MSKITIGVTDDHQLFLKSLVMLIETFSSFEVVLEALNGKELLDKLAEMPERPDILLVDVDMPVMDGIRATAKITRTYPGSRLVALSMKDDDTTVIQMIKAGCCAYLLKDTHPDELEKALIEVYDQGYYNSDLFNLKYRRLALDKSEPDGLTEQEKRFVTLACSDLTYKQVASEMQLSERTIDGYRESVFRKLNVQSRTGMALEAVRRHIVRL